MTETPTFEIDPELIENENVRITEDENGELAIEHKTSGATIRYNSEEESWVVDSFSTERAEIDDRQYTSQQDRTINVPDDYDTIQEAVNQLPYLIRHEWTINVSDGTYDEDVYIPPTHGVHGDEAGEFFTPITIIGDRDAPENVEVDSIFVDGFVGGFLRVAGISFGESHPWEPDNDEAFAAHNSREVVLSDVKISDGSARSAIQSFSSFIWIEGVDLGDGHVDRGLYTKHGGEIWEEANVETPTTGTANKFVYVPNDGQIHFQSAESDATGGDALVQESFTRGFAFDGSEKTLYNVRQNESQFTADVGSSALISPDQSIPSQSFTKVEFDTLLFDHRDEFDTTDHKFVADEDFVAQVQFTWCIDDAADGARLISQLRENGNASLRTQVHASSSDEISCPLNVVIELEEGDELEFYAWHDAGDGREIVGGAERTHAQVVKIG